MAESRRRFAWPLRAAGWKFETGVPSEKKFVILGAPHTSNWDGVLLLVLARTVGLRIEFGIKSEWLRGPMGPILRRLGAIGIDRSGHHNLVDQMVQELRSRDQLALVLTPEGTRSRAEQWKSGFYHIALGAGVPVVPGYMDYARKRAGLGEPIYLTGDVRADMAKIRAFYAEKQPRGRFPENFGPIRLRDELAYDRLDELFAPLARVNELGGEVAGYELASDRGNLSEADQRRLEIVRAEEKAGTERARSLWRELDEHAIVAYDRLVDDVVRGKLGGGEASSAERIQRAKKTRSPVREFDAWAIWSVLAAARRKVD
jgi:1-acyl-sn-glycerol-3-phosphate acyltransferase